MSELSGVIWDYYWKIQLIICKLFYVLNKTQ